ncbi:hypothetical protein [Pseudomonas sp. Y24-6]|uniref:hypothetical protein n=1 Tax=Pseudomonas sp. Y24-6 TaxID=2750013 RepID=UPI001CE22CFE|nr:hypothetical protein [Pseudomonas sp. Y24-6]MCA4961920.1 hypothetical protein [Pseudomonas sp. Y24-6]
MTHEYGKTVAEVFKHSDEELQELIKQKEVAYFRHCMSPAYPELGVNVAWVSEKPLTEALNELAIWFAQGYTVATSFSGPLYLKAQLKKPSTIVDSDLIELAKIAHVEYAASRYARNVAESQRLMQHLIERRAREQATAAAKAAAEHQAKEEEFALADLLRAYAKPVKAKAQKADTPEATPPTAVVGVASLY